MDEVLDMYRKGMTTGSNRFNRQLVSSRSTVGLPLPSWHEEILYDPQTSGGLLAAVGESESRPLLDALHDAGVDAARRIGRVRAPDGSRRLVFVSS
jgi:selenide,water dikinase